MFRTRLSHLRSLPLSERLGAKRSDIYDNDFFVPRDTEVKYRFARREPLQNYTLGGEPRPKQPPPPPKTGKPPPTPVFQEWLDLCQNQKKTNHLRLAAQFSQQLDSLKGEALFEACEWIGSRLKNAGALGVEVAELMGTALKTRWVSPMHPLAPRIFKQIGKLLMVNRANLEKDSFRPSDNPPPPRKAKTTKNVVSFGHRVVEEMVLKEDLIFWLHPPELPGFAWAATKLLKAKQLVHFYQQLYLWLHTNPDLSWIEWSILLFCLHHSSLSKEDVQDCVLLMCQELKHKLEDSDDPERHSEKMPFLAYMASIYSVDTSGRPYSQEPRDRELANAAFEFLSVLEPYVQIGLNIPGKLGVWDTQTVIDTSMALTKVGISSLTLYEKFMKRMIYGLSYESDLSSDMLYRIAYVWLIFEQNFSRNEDDWQAIHSEPLSRLAHEGFQKLYSQATQSPLPPRQLLALSKSCNSMCRTYDPFLSGCLEKLDYSGLSSMDVTCFLRDVSQVGRLNHRLRLAQDMETICGKLNELIKHEVEISSTDLAFTGHSIGLLLYDQPENFLIQQPQVAQLLEEVWARDWTHVTATDEDRSLIFQTYQLLRLGDSDLELRPHVLEECQEAYVRRNKRNLTLKQDQQMGEALQALGYSISSDQTVAGYPISLSLPDEKRIFWSLGVYQCLRNHHGDLAQLKASNLSLARQKIWEAQGWQVIPVYAHEWQALGEDEWGPFLANKI